MSDPWLKCGFVLFFSFLVSCYLIPLFSNLAIKIGALDVPDGKVKFHKQNVPYFGGIGIYCGFISAVALTCPFDEHIVFFIVGVTFLLILGLVDDLLKFAPHQKFFGQSIATLCFLKGGFFLKESFLSNIWSISLSAFWLLFIMVNKILIH